MQNLTLAALLTVPAALANAQSPLSGLPQGVIIEDPSAQTRLLAWKPSGDSPVQPFTEVNPEAPVYTNLALLHHLGSFASTAAPRFKMNAISTGNDNLPVEPESFVGGEPDYWVVNSAAGSGWAAMALSVSDNPTPPLADTVFATRYNATGGAGIGSDLFSYWFDSNSDLPPSLIDAAHFEVGHEHLMAGAGTQVSGLDTYMPAVVEARGEPNNVLQSLDKWFFTLTPDTVTYVKNNWSNFDAAFDCDLGEIDTNYVYTSEWRSGHAWSPIRVLFTPVELGLDSAAETPEIDAIAFFDVPNYRDHIIFSLTEDTSGGCEQILIGGNDVRGANGPGNKPIRLPGGGRINEQIGIANDTEIDALCTYDPEALLDAYGKWLAFPKPSTAPVGIGCSVARYRTYDAQGNTVGEELLLQATRLPGESGVVGWVVVIDGRPPIVIRRALSASRQEYHLPIPPGNEGITIGAACLTTSQLLRSVQVRLLR